MKPRQITKALQHLEQIAKGHQKRLHIDAIHEVPRSETRRWSEEQATAHVRWMCQQALDFVNKGRYEKAQRWLCFGQGVLWALGIENIDAFREANMPEA